MKNVYFVLFVISMFVFASCNNSSSIKEQSRNNDERWNELNEAFDKIDKEAADNKDQSGNDDQIKISLSKKDVWTDEITRLDFTIENMSNKDIDIIYVDISIYSKNGEFLGKSILTTDNIKINQRGVASCDFGNIKPEEIDNFKYSISTIKYYETSSSGDAGELTIKKTNIRQVTSELIWVYYTVTNNSKYFIHNANVDVTAYTKNNEFLGTASISINDIRTGKSINTVQTSFFNISMNDINTLEYKLVKVRASIDGDKELDMTNKFTLKEE